MTFKLTILGSSSALPTVTKYPSAHVLNVHEQFYLIDCGEGVQRQLKKYGINALKINHIFISHLHGDHVYGLFPLISTMGLLGRERALEIFAPAPISEIIQNHLNFFDNWLPYKIVCHEIDTKTPNVIFENKVLEVEVIPLKHSVPTAGFLFREKTPSKNISKFAIEKYSLSLSEITKAKNGEDLLRGDLTISNSEITYNAYTPRTFAYCCDTGYCERIIEQIKGADLLLHEATYLKIDAKPAKKRKHSTTVDAASIASQSQVKQLVIGHFSTRYNCGTEEFLKEAKEIFENTSLAKEGLEFDVKANVIRK